MDTIMDLMSLVDDVQQLMFTEKNIIQDLDTGMNTFLQTIISLDKEVMSLKTNLELFNIVSSRFSLNTIGITQINGYATGESLAGIGAGNYLNTYYNGSTDEGKEENDLNGIFKTISKTGKGLEDMFDLAKRFDVDMSPALENVKHGVETFNKVTDGMEGMGDLLSNISQSNVLTASTLAETSADVLAMAEGAAATEAAFGPEAWPLAAATMLAGGIAYMSSKSDGEEKKPIPDTYTLPAYAHVIDGTSKYHEMIPGIGQELFHLEYPIGNFSGNENPYAIKQFEKAMTYPSIPVEDRDATFHYTHLYNKDRDKVQDMVDDYNDKVQQGMFNLDAGVESKRYTLLSNEAFLQERQKSMAGTQVEDMFEKRIAAHGKKYRDTMTSHIKDFYRDLFSAPNTLDIVEAKQGEKLSEAVLEFFNNEESKYGITDAPGGNNARRATSQRMGYSATPANAGKGITININKPLCEINTMNVKEAKEGVQDIKRMVGEAFLEILYSANAEH